MATAPGRTLKSSDVITDSRSSEGWRTRVFVAWSGLFFAVLQSVCTLFAMLGALHLILGVGAFAAVAQFGAVLDRYHADWLRIPMVGFAVVGSVLSLISLARVRRLRERPASQWRRRTLTARERLVERTQLVVALVTLSLISVEEIVHLRTFHHF